MTTVAATDPDAGTTLTYSLGGGADQAKFQINASTGALSFITAPNFEAPTDSDHNNSYIVQVRASDGSLSDTQTITVNVSDVLDVDAINGGAYSDLGGDHRADVFLHNQNGTVALWQMNGGQVLSAAIIGSVGTEWDVQSTADFNGDGRGDVLWRATDGKVMVWTMNGPQIQNAQIVGAVGNEWHVQGTGDLDGDGIADLVWRHDDGTLMLWKMNGVQIQSVQFFGSVGNEWHVVGIGDFNGDGKSDILWRGRQWRGARFPDERDANPVGADRRLARARLARRRGGRFQRRRQERHPVAQRRWLAADHADERRSDSSGGVPGHANE